MPRTAYAVSGVAAAIVLAVAGCGSSSKKTASTPSTPATTSAPTQTQTTPAPKGGGTLTVGETEYKLNPSNPTAKAGAVTVTAKNDGTITHNLEVQGNGVEKKTADLQPGSSGSLKLNLKPGTYQIYCAIPGHKQLGMKGNLVVK